MRNALVASIIFATFFCGTVYGQSYRYIDEAGNINFVDRLDQIPLRYREQVLPTATPIIDRKAWVRAQREEEKKRRYLEKQAEKQRRAQEKERQRREKEERRRAEKEAKHAAATATAAAPKGALIPKQAQAPTPPPAPVAQPQSPGPAAPSSLEEQ